jgi:hypothetical protein
VLRHLLNVKVALLALALIAAALGVGNAFVALFVPARYELIYQFSLSVHHCLASRCAYSAVFEIANSGRNLQEVVQVTLKGIPEAAGGSPRVLNLDASMPRERDPLIQQHRTGDTLKIRLQPLWPGTLAQFHFSGVFAGDELAGALEPMVHVEGRGRLIEGDPRGMAFGRWFTVRPERPGKVVACAPLFTVVRGG